MVYPGKNIYLCCAVFWPFVLYTIKTCRNLNFTNAFFPRSTVRRRLIKRAKSEDKHSLQTAEDPSSAEDAESNQPITYRAPRDGSVDYPVDRTPAEAAQQLLAFGAATDDDEGNDTDSVTDQEDEDNNQAGGDGNSTGGEAGRGGKGAKGAKGRGGSGVGIGSANVLVAPRYWRGNFVPLGEEELQALELEQGNEALVEYLDKR